MAVGVIMIAVLSIVAVIMAWNAFAPIINELGSGDPAVEEEFGHWTNASAQAIFARDQSFRSLLVLPLVLIGAIMTWAFLAVTRRDFTAGDY